MLYQIWYTSRQWGQLGRWVQYSCSAFYCTCFSAKCCPVKAVGSIFTIYPSDRAFSVKDMRVMIDILPLSFLGGQYASKAPVFAPKCYIYCQKLYISRSFEMSTHGVNKIGVGILNGDIVSVVLRSLKAFYTRQWCEI